MRTKVYSFKPKGKGYDVFVTKTYHGSPQRADRSDYRRRSGGMSGILIGMVAKGILSGIFKKKY